MGIEAIAGVIIWTERSRHETMAAFYRDTLGLVPRTVRDGFTNFEWGDVRLTVAAHSEVAGPAEEAGRMMINLAVADIHATAARLREAGVTFSREPQVLRGQPG